jgi:hypothetical protein
MRSNIRTAMRGAEGPARQLLQNAERATTQAMESQLSPDMAAALRATDAQYALYKTIENAVGRAGDSPSGFTPHQLTTAIRQSISDPAFARGGGGDLRQLSSAGRRVFESVSPPTGARLLTVGPLGEYVTGPFAMALNRGKPAGAAKALPPAVGSAFARAAAAVLPLASRNETHPALAGANTGDER